MHDATRELSAATLLAHAGWIRQLAAKLVFDPGRVDDVVQQAWLEVVRRPPAHGANPRSWLSRVVTNAARQLGRTERRRRDREVRAAAQQLRGDQPSTEELVAQAESQRNLVSAVLSLDEPYRSTVLLHFFQARSPKEIADAQGIPAATVRSRLRRALELLRNRLDEEHGGDRHSWAFALVGLCNQQPASPLAAGSWFAATIGFLIMNSKIALTVGAGLVALLLGWVTWSPTPEPIPASVRAESGTSPAEEASATTASTASKSQIRAEVPTPQVEYRGLVSDPNGEGVAGAQLTLLRGGILTEGSTRADGRFTLRAPASSRSTAVKVAAEGFRTTTRRPIRPSEEIEISLQWVATLTGRVIEHGSAQPIPNIRIASSISETVSDGQGRFRLESVLVGRPIEVTAEGEGYAPERQRLQLGGPETKEIAIRLHPARPITIQVVDHHSGEPLSGVQARGAWGRKRTHSDADGLFSLPWTPGRDINLDLEHPGYADVRWNWLPDHDDLRDRLIEGEPAARVPMQSLCWVTGEVRDTQGNAVAEAWVFASNPAFERRSLEIGNVAREGSTRFRLPREGRLPKASEAGPGLHARFDGNPRVSVRHEAEMLHSRGGHHVTLSDARRPILGVQTDAAGRFAVPLLAEAQPYQLLACHDAYLPGRSKPFLVPPEGLQEPLSLVLQSGAIVQGNIRRNGEAWPNVWVEWRQTATGGRGVCEPDGEGRYRLTGIPPGTIRIGLLDRFDGSVPDPATLSVELGEEYELDFGWEEPTGPISGRITDHQGNPVAGARVHAHPDRGWAHQNWCETDAEGRYELQVPVDESQYVYLNRDPVRRQRSHVMAGTEGVDFVLPAMGTARVQLVHADTGEPLRDLNASARRSLAWRESGAGEFRTIRGSVDVDGILELKVPMPSIDLMLHLRGAGFAPVHAHGIPVSDELRPDPTPVELVPGVDVEFLVRGEGPLNEAALRDSVVLVLEDYQRERIRGPFPMQGSNANYNIGGVHLWVDEPPLLNQRFRGHNGGRELLRGLLPGRYHVQVYPPGLRFSPDVFEVNPDTTRIELSWSR